jgi:hypothetical protein
MIRRILSDLVFWFTALTAAAGLIVSAPATFAVVRRYHDDGTLMGLYASIALVIVLELATTAAKFAAVLGYVAPGQRRALLLFCLFGLGINAASNAQTGAHLAARAGDTGIALWAGAIVYAALISVVIYLMLHLCAHRVAELRSAAHGGRLEVERAIEPVRVMVAQAAGIMRELDGLRVIDAPPAPQLVQAAREADALPTPIAHAVREPYAVYAELRAAGASSRSAATQAGIAESTARQRWDRERA